MAPETDALMSTAISTVRRIHRALHALDDAADAGNDDAAFLARALRDWLTAGQFESALGLSGGWRDAVAEDQADRALIGLASAYAEGMSYRQVAAEIMRRMRRYETTRYAIDRALGCRPPDPEGLLFDYLRAGGPSSVERVRRLLPGLRRSVQ